MVDHVRWTKERMAILGLSVWSVVATCMCSERGDDAIAEGRRADILADTARELEGDVARESYSLSVCASSLSECRADVDSCESDRSDVSYAYKRCKDAVDIYKDVGDDYIEDLKRRARHR